MQIAKPSLSLLPANIYFIGDFTSAQIKHHYSGAFA
jgi:hypothetical protein